jgi:hypothetical protein
MRRRDFVRFLPALSAGSTAFGDTALILAQEQEKLTRDTLIQAERIAGISFTDAQRDLILPALQNYVQAMQAVRNLSVPPEVTPAMHFLPDVRGTWTLKRPGRKEV